ncbi:MAG: hypothetical protein ACRC0S_02175 [Fusobacteriaceae bacterium]
MKDFRDTLISEVNFLEINKDIEANIGDNWEQMLQDESKKNSEHFWRYVVIIAQLIAHHKS